MDTQSPLTGGPFMHWINYSTGITESNNNLLRTSGLFAMIKGKRRARTQHAVDAVLSTV